jgi:hypothetical protein
VDKEICYDKNDNMYLQTEEYRSPKKGEFYLGSDYNTHSVRCAEFDFIYEKARIVVPYQESKPTFVDAKVGDKVYSLRYGEGIIEGFYPYDTVRPFRVMFTKGGCVAYGIDGRLSKLDITPDLYWAKPEIIAPPMPKRKVKKSIELFLNIYIDCASNKPCSFSYTTKEKAIEIAEQMKPASAVGVAEPFIYNYETEE